MKQTNKEFHQARRLIQLQFTFSQFIKRLTVNTKNISQCITTKNNMKPARLDVLHGGLKMTPTKEFCKE